MTFLWFPTFFSSFYSCLSCFIRVVISVFCQRWRRHLFWCDVENWLSFGLSYIRGWIWGIFETREYLWQKHQTGSGRNTQSFCKQFKMIRPILSETDRADQGWRGTVSSGHLGAVWGTHEDKTVQLYVLIWMTSSQNNKNTNIQMVFWNNWLLRHLGNSTSAQTYCSYYHQLVL